MTAGFTAMTTPKTLSVESYRHKADQPSLPFPALDDLQGGEMTIRAHAGHICIIQRRPAGEIVVIAVEPRYAPDLMRLIEEAAQELMGGTAP